MQSSREHEKAQLQWNCKKKVIIQQLSYRFVWRRLCTEFKVWKGPGWNMRADGSSNLFDPEDPRPASCWRLMLLRSTMHTRSRTTLELAWIILYSLFLRTRYQASRFRNLALCNNHNLSYEKFTEIKKSLLMDLHFVFWKLKVPFSHFIIHSQLKWKKKFRQLLVLCAKSLISNISLKFWCFDKLCLIVNKIWWQFYYWINCTILLYSLWWNCSKFSF